VGQQLFLGSLQQGRKTLLLEFCCFYWPHSSVNILRIYRIDTIWSYNKYFLGFDSIVRRRAEQEDTTDVRRREGMEDSQMI